MLRTYDIHSTDAGRSSEHSRVVPPAPGVSGALRVAGTSCSVRPQSLRLHAVVPQRLGRVHDAAPQEGASDGTSLIRLARLASVRSPLGARVALA